MRSRPGPKLLKYLINFCQYELVLSISIHRYHGAPPNCYIFWRMTIPTHLKLHNKTSDSQTLFYFDISACTGPDAVKLRRVTSVRRPKNILQQQLASSSLRRLLFRGPKRADSDGPASVSAGQWAAAVRMRATQRVRATSAGPTGSRGSARRPLWTDRSGCYASGSL